MTVGELIEELTGWPEQLVVTVDVEPDGPFELRVRNVDMDDLDTMLVIYTEKPAEDGPHGDPAIDTGANGEPVYRQEDH